MCVRARRALNHQSSACRGVQREVRAAAVRAQGQQNSQLIQNIDPSVHILRTIQPSARLLFGLLLPRYHCSAALPINHRHHVTSVSRAVLHE